MLEGVLPLHLAERLGQAQIGALYVGASLIVATTGAAVRRETAAAARVRSARTRRCRDHPCGLVTAVPLWVLALLLAATGIGLANTGSLGLLIGAVPVERIVSAMVVWSQVGIIGYLLGPLAGGVIAEELGYTLVGLVPAVGAVLVLLLRPDVLPAQAPVVLDRHAA